MISTNRIFAIVVMFLSGTTLIFMIGFMASRPISASDDLNLSDKLKNLVAQNVTITVRFATPTEGKTEYWIIPEKLGADESGLRTMSEIGSDYFCVRKAGEGAIDVKCVPFANIAEITYTDQP